MEAAGCSYQFRIALLGDAAVGKTSLLRCYVAGARGAAEPDSEPTVGVEFYSRALRLPSGLRVKLQLWDTAGQERFRCGRKRVMSVTWGTLSHRCQLQGLKQGSVVPTLLTPPYSLIHPTNSAEWAKPSAPACAVFEPHPQSPYPAVEERQHKGNLHWNSDFPRDAESPRNSKQSCQRDGKEDWCGGIGGSCWTGSLLRISGWRWDGL